MYPRMVSRMFIQKSAPSPTSINTPSGGRMIAKSILKKSVQVTAIFNVKPVNFLFLKSTVTECIWIPKRLPKNNHNMHANEAFPAL